MAKRQREMAKREKAEAKRARRNKMKQDGNSEEPPVIMGEEGPEDVDETVSPEESQE